MYSEVRTDSPVPFPHGIAASRVREISLLRSPEQRLAILWTVAWMGSFGARVVVMKERAQNKKVLGAESSRDKASQFPFLPHLEVSPKAPEEDLCPKSQKGPGNRGSRLGWRCANSMAGQT